MFKVLNTIYGLCAIAIIGWLASPVNSDLSSTNTTLIQLHSDNIRLINLTNNSVKLDQKIITTTTIQSIKIPASAKCPQWWPTAIKAGWPKDLLPKLDRIMYRESRCIKTTKNSTDPNGGSNGLTQINQFWCKPSKYSQHGFLIDLKIIKSCKDLYNPLLNLRSAKAIYNYSLERNSNGWAPWSL